MKLYFIGLLILLILLIYIYFNFLHNFDASNEKIAENKVSDLKRKDTKVSIKQTTEKKRTFVEVNQIKNTTQKGDLNKNNPSLLKKYENFLFSSANDEISNLETLFENQQIKFGTLNDYTLDVIRTILKNYNLKKRIYIKLVVKSLKNLILSILNNFIKEFNKNLTKEFKIKILEFTSSFKNFYDFKNKDEDIQNFVKLFDEVINNFDCVKNAKSEDICKYYMSLVSIYLVKNLLKTFELKNFNINDLQGFEHIYDTYFKKIESSLPLKLQQIMSNLLFLFVKLLEINESQSINTLFCMYFEVDLCYRRYFTCKPKHFNFWDLLLDKTFDLYEFCIQYYLSIYKLTEVLGEKHYLITKNFEEYSWKEFLCKFKLFYLRYVLFNFYFLKIKFIYSKLCNFKQNLDKIVAHKIF